MSEENRELEGLILDDVQDFAFTTPRWSVRRVLSEPSQPPESQPLITTPSPEPSSQIVPPVITPSLPVNPVIPGGFFSSANQASDGKTPVAPADNRNVPEPFVSRSEPALP